MSLFKRAAAVPCSNHYPSACFNRKESLLLLQKSMNHGQFTRRLGEDLEKRLGPLRNDNVKIYYDHGPKGMHKVVPFFGEYSSASTLSNVDCAIVFAKQALILCEIEEETASPKKIVGDICNLFLADRIRIGGGDFSFEKSDFFLGVRTRKGGKGEEKIKSLKDLITNSVKKKALHDIKIHIFCDTENEKLIRSVADEILKIVTVRLRRLS